MQVIDTMEQDAEQDGAVDEGRATERVVSCISTPEQEEWCGRYFVRKRPYRDGWGRPHVRLTFRLLSGAERTTVGPTLEDAIETARQMQRAAEMVRFGGRCA